VSLHRGLLDTFGSALRTGIQGRVASIFQPRQQSIVGPAVLAAGAAGRVLPAIGRTVGGIIRSRSAGAAAAGVAVGGLLAGAEGQGGGCPVGFHPNKQDGVGGPRGTYCVRNRRMNVGNARAARRSVRRLKGARKLLRDIEKMMPTKTTRRRAPTGHSAHLHHTGA